MTRTGLVLLAPSPLDGAEYPFEGAAYPFVGGVAWLLDAIPDGFTGAPTAFGVAPWGAWNGLDRQNAQLDPLLDPPLLEQPEITTTAPTANIQRIVVMDRMANILGNRQMTERSVIRIEQWRSFDYSFSANFAGYAGNSPGKRRTCLALGGHGASSGGL